MTVLASPAVGPHRRPPRPAPAARDRRRRADVACADADRRRAARRRSRGCSRPTSSSGSASASSTRRSRTPRCPGCRAPRRASPRRSRRPRARSARRSAWPSSGRSSALTRAADLASASHPGWWTLAACGALVLAARPRGDHHARGRVGPAHGGRSSIRRRSLRRSRRMSEPSDDSDAAREVWLLMSDLVLDNTRRREVSDAPGMSFGRSRARPPARAPADVDGRARRRRSASTRRTRPCVVADLESHGLVRRRAASHRRTRQAGRGRRARARSWPGGPTRSSPRRRRGSARSSAEDLETLRRILGTVG